MGSGYLATAAVTLATFGLALGVFLRLRKRLHAPWRGLGGALLLVVALRMVLFWNPLAWRAYLRALGVDDVGFMPYTFMAAFQELKFKRDIWPPRTETVIVGSSQVDALFNNDVTREAGVLVFSIAGLGPSGYLPYKSALRCYNPRRVILYLSEFDIGSHPLAPSFAYTPPSWARFWNLYRVRRFDKRMGLAYQFPAAILLADFFPEYKYSFVFGGLLARATGRNAATGRKTFGELTPEQLLAIHLKGLGNLEEEAIPLNLGFLEDFVEFCGKEDMQVVIVEGQYHPLAFREQNIRLHEEVKDAIERLCAEHPNARHIPRSEIYEFAESEFADGTHVTKEAGAHFTRALLSRLKKTPIEDERPGRGTTR
jgi:hypothetical protein